ncbi:MAG: DUF4159 domain-containing protein [Bacteroidetes bacterium]|nr:DUF4159 domain-containing protein [Bacteroidota bacterium]
MGYKRNVGYRSVGKKFISSISLIAFISLLFSFSPPTYQIARLKYNGGGDWYVSPTSLPNLIRFCNKNLGTNINEEENVVETGSKDIFNFPFVHMTGHGNVSFSTQEAENLRNYMISGGFLNINDSYGMNIFIRREMKKVFPETDFVELPPSHPIFHQKYDFPNGIPKIHEHDGKPAQAFGIIYNGRLVCLFNFECDIGDGWEDPEVHHDSEETRQKALKMGANIIQYVFMGENSIKK